MSLIISCSPKPALVRQALRCGPATLSIAASHAQNILNPSTSVTQRATGFSSRSYEPLDRSSPRRGNASSPVFRISPDQVRPLARSRTHLPLFSKQTRFKSAIFDHDAYDYSEHMKNAFDAGFYKKVVEMNKKAYDDIVKQAEKVLHGHVHDKATNSLKILDLASGPGEPAASLAKAFPEATVYSTDINPGMVEAAKKRMSSLGISNVKTEEVNMEDMSNFDDEMFDLVTCSFGLIFCEDPDMALYEIQRVLKPGGTFISTVWDSISTERASDPLLKAACGNMIPPERILDPMAFAKPRLLENLLGKNHLSLVNVSHGEYPFDLSPHGDDDPEEFAFRFVSMGVFPNLTELVESGDNPHAMNDAKEAFKEIIAHGSDWIKQKDGRLVTVPNRYKLAVARRAYEKVTLEKKPTVKSKKRLNLYPVTSIGKKTTPAQISEAFDSVLVDTYNRISNGPWEHMLKNVESILHGQDTTKTRILDLSSGPGGPVCMLAQRFPRASVVATDASSKIVEQLKKKTAGFRNTRVVAADPQNLSSFQTASYDVVTCSFGLSTLTEEGARKALKEVHRVLKPGGSLVATVWDSLSIEHMSDEIMSAVVGEDAGPMPPRVIDYTSFAAPRKLEEMIEGDGSMSVIQVDHDEFSFQLSGLGHLPDDFAFNVVTIPIHPNLVQLQESGKRPNALEDARSAFNKIVDEGDLVHTDEQGRMWAGPNRFKVVVARRQYEDTDK